MKFISTRGHDEKNTSYEAIFQGLAGDGGLFVPETLPTFDWENYLGKNAGYPVIAADVMGHIFDDIEEEKLLEMAEHAYDEKFYKEEVIGVTSIEDIHFLELYHGPTAAFKDFALSILPLFLQEAKGEREVVILTATSGDTGKAALEGFKDVAGTEIYVFYPTEGVSSMQKLQMMTQEGKNVHVFGVEGNFDDAQTGVKRIFQSEDVKAWAEEHDLSLSSANSINIGRLVPQIAYYFAAYITLVDRGELVAGDGLNVCVPTGNFGDILAGYYAKKMGLPLGQFVCASNGNQVLTDFFGSGTYDANRNLIKTESPSMDILISSNLERLLYEVAKDPEEVAEYMADLKAGRVFTVTEDLHEVLLAEFHGFTTSDRTGKRRIGEVFHNHHYLMDPHTAVAYDAVLQYRAVNWDRAPFLLVSTASAFKFPEAVAEALGIDFETGIDALEQISDKTGVPVHPALQDLEQKTVLHEGVIRKEEMEEIMKEGWHD